MSSQPTFFKVATKAKYIGGLIFALAVAAVFALLAQWQIDRTYRYVPKTPTNQTAIALSDLADSSAPFLPAQADRVVTLTGTPIAGQVYVIKNRIQLGAESESRTGAWIVRPVINDEGKLVTLALGWFETEAAAVAKAEAMRPLAEDQMLKPYKGIYEPTEDPRPSANQTFESLSIPQIINQPGLSQNIDAYAGFVIVQEGEIVGEKIVIGNNPGENIFNWLTAFYALEWTLFAGFAVFLWGRTVKDELNRELAKGRID